VIRVHDRVKPALLIALGALILCACNLARVTPTPPPTITPTFVPAATLPIIVVPSITPLGTLQPTPPQFLTNSACIPTQPTGWVTYTIVAGDSLIGLAQTTQTSVQSLMTINCISNPDNIFVGQVIFLPFTPPPQG
jgi:hypothetical protein